MHEAGCCPDFDENGNQLNMKCICGATIPLNAKSSICATCLRTDNDFDDDFDNEDMDTGYDDDYDGDNY
jgi:hypothetical protein